MEDKLIIAVGNRPILYDQSLYTYRDTNRRDLAWRESSLEVGEPGNIMIQIIFDLCISEYIATTGSILQYKRAITKCRKNVALFL